jgi:hypothetical protein
VTEHEYCVVSALQRLWAAASLVMDALPLDEVPGMAAKRLAALRAIRHMTDRLEKEVERLMEDPDDAG